MYINISTIIAHENSREFCHSMQDNSTQWNLTLNIPLSGELHVYTAVRFSVTSSTFPFSMLCLIMNVEIYSAFFCLFVHDTHCHTHMACLDPLGMLVPVSFSSHQHHMTGHIKKLHVNTHRFMYSWQPVYFTQVQLEKHCYFPPSSFKQILLHSINYT